MLRDQAQCGARHGSQAATYDSTDRKCSLACRRASAGSRSLRADLPKTAASCLVPTLINREDTWSGNERLDNRPEPISGTKQSKAISPISRIANGFIGSPTKWDGIFIGYECRRFKPPLDWFDHEAQSGREAKLAV